MKTVLKVLLWLVLIALAIAAGYVGYVWFSYSRIEDERPLSITGTQQAQAPIGKELSVLTMNIGYGANDPEFSFFMDGGKRMTALDEETVRRTTGGVTSIIREADPELVLLQEVDQNSDRSHHVNQMEEISSALGDYASVYAVNYNTPYLFFPPTDPMGRVLSGILTLSKYRIESSVRRSLPLESGFKKLFDLDRCFSLSRLPTENGRYLTLVNIHASAFVEDQAVRDAQTECLLGALQDARDAGDYVICGGDFNHDLKGGHASELFGFEPRDAAWLSPFDEEMLPDDLRLVSSSNAPTLRDSAVMYVPGESFVTIIDGFIVSEDVTLSSIETIDAGFEYSDHNPVLMRLTLNP